MATSYPSTIPHPWDKDDVLTDAYRRGWSHGHGIACHNVPRLEDKLFLDDLGRVTVDPENIREVHQSLCFGAADNARCFSPFEFTAHEFNSHDLETDNISSEECWEAFGAGTADAIFADLAEYSDDDYGIEPEADDESDESDD